VVQRFLGIKPRKLRTQDNVLEISLVTTQVSYPGEYPPVKREYCKQIKAQIKAMNTIPSQVTDSLGLYGVLTFLMSDM
jgi:hypothetical protein